MPRPRGSIRTPSYCKHKSSGRAYVTIDGRPVYLGPHGSQESKDEYARVVSEWLASGRHHAASATTTAMDPAPDLSVSTLLASFWEHAKNEYPAQVIPGRRPAGELGMYFDVLRPLRRLYGATPA